MTRGRARPVRLDTAPPKFTDRTQAAASSGVPVTRLTLNSGSAPVASHSSSSRWLFMRVGCSARVKACSLVGAAQWNTSPCRPPG